MSIKAYSTSVLVVYLLFFHLFAATCQSDTVWNTTDSKGMKQGHWKSFYENGKLKYKGFFKDNKPVGDFVRYFDDGTIKAKQYFVPNTSISYTTMYYENGQNAAKGKYVGSLKDSVWQYFSYYDKTLRMKETYSLGKKNGIAIRVYNNGNASERLVWKNDIKEGEWLMYFENSSPKLEGFYKNDKREGLYKMYRPDGSLEMQGMFENNVMQGKWNYYDEKGNVKMEITYINGVPQNASQLEENQRKIFEMIEKNKGLIPEPDENNMGPQ